MVATPGQICISKDPIVEATWTRYTFHERLFTTTAANDCSEPICALGAHCTNIGFLVYLVGKTRI